MTVIRDVNEDALLMDGFDDDVIGICHQFGRPPVAVYDLGKVLARLQQDGMFEEEAGNSGSSTSWGHGWEQILRSFLN